jgi:hypothetical protein
MANSTHIPGLLRGHKGTIVMVDHGMFEGETDHITVSGERTYLDEFVEKWGYSSVQIPVEPDQRDAHMANFFHCVRTREKPVLDADTGYKAQVTISMGVQAYREGRVLYFDPVREEVMTSPPKV